MLHLLELLVIKGLLGRTSVVDELLGVLHLVLGVVVLRVEVLGGQRVAHGERLTVLGKVVAAS